MRRSLSVSARKYGVAGLLTPLPAHGGAGGGAGAGSVATPPSAGPAVALGDGTNRDHTTPPSSGQLGAKPLHGEEHAQPRHAHGENDAQPQEWRPAQQQQQQPQQQHQSQQHQQQPQQQLQQEQQQQQQPQQQPQQQQQMVRPQAGQQTPASGQEPRASPALGPLLLVPSAQHATPAPAQALASPAGATGAPSTQRPKSSSWQQRLAARRAAKEAMREERLQEERGRAAAACGGDSSFAGGGRGETGAGGLAAVPPEAASEALLQPPQPAGEGQDQQWGHSWQEPARGEEQQSPKRPRLLRNTLGAVGGLSETALAADLPPWQHQPEAGKRGEWQVQVDERQPWQQQQQQRWQQQQQQEEVERPGADEQDAWHQQRGEGIFGAGWQQAHDGGRGGGPDHAMSDAGLARPAPAAAAARPPERQRAGLPAQRPVVWRRPGAGEGPAWGGAEGIEACDSEPEGGFGFGGGGGDDGSDVMVTGVRVPPPPPAAAAAAPLGGGGAGGGGAWAQQPARPPAWEPPAGGAPWWSRLPDFVPVEALAGGWDPRNQQPVHIDYKNQFSGAADGGAAGGASYVPPAPRAGRGSGSGGGKKRGKGRSKARAAPAAEEGGGGAGHWSTRADGTRVFVTSGGALTGAAAWRAYKGGSKRSGGGSKKAGGSGRKRGRK
ncbi:hypothetical protein Rsub_05198 [Raphidocelis subcapitata]|uniref:Uncharacterized protein n=1 Tax=Raphidocelis subcapitata TaxID=307507 RepID=A0A2V0NY77_9CHLO|nr:hypothetical protein Rsub_05198 [Raphidocelis subcapitata]|eukprot:GBF92584.1 hypothetical protein Rsub_05198 [Raphidocelis subcapitata]